MSLQRTESKRNKSSGRGANAKFLYRKQLRLPDGKRPTIQLGTLSVKEADEINSHIDKLVAAKRHGTAIEPATVAWLRAANKKLVNKLVALGLCEASNDPLVTEFVKNYIDSRKSDWAGNTVINFRQLEKLIIERFAGKRMREINRKDAIDFYNWMRTTKKLGENTARRKLGRSREMFLEALEQGIISENPFKTRKLKVAVGAANKVYIDEATVNEVIEHCPTTEWKLLFVFARYVGCRIPSEIQDLTWDDVNVDKGTILIKSPKTKRYGKGERLVPIFPEIAGLLSKQWSEAQEGDTHVFSKLRNHTNLGTTAKRYVKAAGILPWSDFWNTLRASRETDLMDSHGPNDACRWIGNTLAVAAKHYQLMKKEAYSGRVIKSHVTEAQNGAGESAVEAVNSKLNSTSKSYVKSHDAGARNEPNGAENRVGIPINSLVFGETITPNRTRTCD